MPKVVTGLACSAALLLTLCVRGSHISLSDSHHAATKAPAATVNTYVLSDVPDAIAPRNASTLAAPAILTRFRLYPKTSYQATPQESFQHNRAPPAI